MSEQEFWRSTLRQLVVLERFRQKQYEEAAAEPPPERGTAQDLIAWARKG